MRLYNKQNVSKQNVSKQRHKMPDFVYGTWYMYMCNKICLYLYLKTSRD